MKKIALITGASGGMGRIFAQTLKEHGAYDEVWAIARNEEKLRALQNEVPFPVRVIPLDLGKEQSAEVLKKLLEEQQPDIRLCINCAGYGIFDAVEKTEYEKNIGMLDLNCRALTAVTMLCLPYMREGARLLNVASVAAFQPIPYINIYGATKAYVLSFTRALARELQERKIRVMALCPFWTRTAFFDRAIKEDAAPVVKKYAAMYEPEYIVSYAWKKLEKTNRDYCIPGFTAKLQVLAVKLLPHRLIMTAWQKQQGLK